MITPDHDERFFARINHFKNQCFNHLAFAVAQGIGDIGRLFPDTDPRWKGADSIALLKSAIAKVHDAGYRVSNVDVTVIAQKPKLLPHLESMRANLAAALAVEPGAVSVKGKTNEGVESMGRSESMACHAIALLQSA